MLSAKKAQEAADLLQRCMVHEGRIEASESGCGVCVCLGVNARKGTICKIRNSSSPSTAGGFVGRINRLVTNSNSCKTAETCMVDLPQ